MPDFKDSVARVLDIEAGYSNDPVDRGGETICGVARKFWPDWEGWLIVDRMKEKDIEPTVTPQLKALAEQLYRVHFWNRVHADELENSEVAFEVFEIAVNASVNKASLLLQEALNLLNRNGKSWPELALDGAIGPRTVANVRVILRERNGARSLVRAINALQAEHYLRLARKSPTQERFLRGWLERA